MIPREWIISHRCSWMAVYVFCYKAQSKSHSDPHDICTLSLFYQLPNCNAQSKSHSDPHDKRSSKKSTFISYSVLIDFCHYLCLPLDRFLFEFFESCYNCICFICGVFELKPEPKRVDLLLCLC
jgi:hypothetical protein